MKKTKLANVLLLHYLLLFSIIVGVLLGIIFFVDYATDHIIKSKPLYNLKAEDIMRDDYQNIDASDIIKLGGGLQIIDKNYVVILSKGVNPDGVTLYTKSSFTKFLANSGNYFDNNYYYYITYNEKADFWLKVEIPFNVVISRGVFVDDKGVTRVVNNARFLLIAMIFIITIMLIIGLTTYSRIASRTFVKPLKKLASGVTKIAGGDYSARVELKSQNEFGELTNAFNHMAQKIETEQKLRRKSEANRKRLILDISHDLKNPLANIMGYAELLIRDKNITEEERLNYLRIILNNSQRSNGLIGDLFQLSKMESPEFQLKLENTDICEYLREWIAQAIPQLEESEFSYEFNIPKEGIFVAIDEKEMDRAMTNIINNAIKYNKAGTQIKIKLIKEATKVIIDIEDNGIGIPKAMITDIFEPFVRVDSARNSKTGGTGLGLSITKAIIEKHGGKISLESGIYKGCRFIIELGLSH